MRRLAVVCAIATTIFAAFAIIEKNPRVAAAAQQPGPLPGVPSSALGIVSVSKVAVIASNLAIRALGISRTDPNAAVDLTNAAAPNQIFTLGGLPLTLQSLPASPVANVRISAVAGTGAAGSLGDGGTATAAQFDLKGASLFERSGIAIAPDGTIFVADAGNATIRAIAGPSSTEPGVVRSVAGRWAGQQNIALIEPMAVALDRTGNLYIADRGAGSVDLLPAGSTQLQLLAHVSSPGSMDVSSDGTAVFVASLDNGAVFKINVQSRGLESLPAFPPSASSTSSLCGPPAPSASTQPTCPAGLAVDAAGNLFVSDASNGRILRMDSKTKALTVLASGLNQPGAIAFDSTGNLYVAEQGLSRLVAFAQVGSSQGSISLTPASASFANTPIGGGSTATQSFTLSASAAISGLSIPKATTPADFTVESNSCTVTLAANSNCTFSIAFTPTASGSRSGTLTVTDSNASDSASTVLSGTGDDYQLQLASGQQMQISIQAGQSTTFNLQVVPDSTFSGTVALVCPGNLPENSTCTFSSSTLNVTPGKAVPFQVTFQTTGVINPLNSWFPDWRIGRPVPPHFSSPGTLALVAVLAMLICCLMAIVLRSLTERHLSIPALPAIAVLAVAAAAVLAGCHKTVTNASISPTPPGQTTMAVTGNSQNASRAVSITLVVLSQ